jgi:septum formation protein
MFPKELKQYKVILASSSPRRRELLQSLPVSFAVTKPDFDEIPSPGEDPTAYVLRNGLGKALSVEVDLQNSHSEPFVIISADTIVVLDGRIIEKPIDHNDAKAILQSLSNRTHQVITGVVIRCRGPQGLPAKTLQISVTTDVTFDQLSDSDIVDYIATEEPMDKAGAYGMQGMGAFMVKAIRGSHSNVIGLPLAETRNLLIQAIDWPQKKHS